MCGTLKEWDHRWLNNLQYLVITARSVAHLAEQVGRPEDGSSREKAEAAEVAAAASVEVAADAGKPRESSSIEVAARYQWRRPLMHPAEK